MQLENKTAIVTGGASGIGRATAILFAKEGANVVVVDWAEENANETVELIKKDGGKAIAVKTDVSNLIDIDSAISACLKEFGRIDILVNNAGVAKLSPFAETTEEDWDRVLDINLKGAFFFSQKALVEIEKQGKGKIVNVTSIAGEVGFFGASAYCASKGGLANLTRALALECAPKKINVNAVAPGVIKTAMTEDILSDQETVKAMEGDTPYPRFGEPEDIAEAILYLSSDKSDFVNGEVLVVDGGWVAK